MTTGLAGAASRQWHRLRQRRYARQGWFRAPGGPGPLLWVWAATALDAKLAAELVRGVRSVRLDVRAVVTVPDKGRSSVRELLADYPGVGLAPPPAPRRRTFARAASRLAANGLLVVGGAPGRRPLRGAVDAGTGLAAVNAEPPRGRSPLPWGPVIVDRRSRGRRWQASGVVPGAEADLAPLLVPTNLDPDFKALAAPGPERRMYWCDRLPRGRRERRRFVEEWGAGQNRLVVSGSAGKAVQGLQGVALQPLSTWDRQPPSQGTVLWADEEPWLPAVAASADAAFLADDVPARLWAALGQGVPLVLGEQARAGLLDRHVEAGEAGEAAAGAQEAACQWRRWLEHPFEVRERQARARQAFWQARRAAEQALGCLDRWVDAW